MKRWLFTCMVLTGLVIACQKDDGGDAGKATYDKSAFLSHVVADHVFPLHASFVEKSRALEQAVLAFTQVPQLNELTSMRSAWHEASLAYRQCEVFDVGDVAKTYIHQSFSFYPANENQVEAYIQGTENLDSIFFEFAGSNTKGLFVLEYLCFGGDDQAILDSFLLSVNGLRRREYLEGLAENFRSKAEALNQYWRTTGSDYGQVFSSDVSTGLNGSVSLTVNAISNLTERIAVKKLGKPLGKIAGVPKNSSLFRQSLSKTSKENIAANLASIRHLIEGKEGGYGLNAVLNDLGSKTNGQNLSSAMTELLQAIELDMEEIGPVIEAELEADEAKVEQLYQDVRTLLLYLKTDVAEAMSVTITISDSDGD